MYNLTVPVICSTAYKYREETLAQLKKCGATRVALALKREMAYGFSSEENLRKLGELIEYFRAEGLEIMVWIGETIGHDRYSPPVNSYGYDTMRTLDGPDISALCPLGEKFGETVSNWAKKIAALSPDIIILDDDFRMGDNFGCCCELHMQLIRKSLGEDISVCELKKRVLGKENNRYRRAYLDAQGAGLKDLARKVRAAVNEVNPKVRIGACITSDRWDADGAGPEEIADILAGDTRPYIRLFGAPYHRVIYPLYHAIERERTQFNWLRTSRAEIATEGDTYPRPRYACPASYLECFDMILRADGGADGIMKYMIDYYASPSYEDEYIDRHAKNAPIYKQIEEIFGGGECVGFTPYLPLEKLADSDLSFTEQRGFRGLGEQVFEYNSPYELLSSSSLPSAYSGGDVKIVFGECAHRITDEELLGGAIIDIDAARILIGRGIDVGIKEISDVPLFSQDGFYDVPYEYFPENDEYVRLDPIDICGYTLCPEARVLSRLTKGNETYDFVYTYENESGMRFLVFPFSARAAKDGIGYFKSYRRKKQLTDAYEYISGRPLDAYVKTAHPSLYTLVKRDENSLKIGIWNLFDDKADSLGIKVNRQINSVEFVNCDGYWKDGEITVTSTVYPYEFCAVKIY